MTNAASALTAKGTGDSTSPPAIEVHNLVKTYRGNVRALDGLSLRVQSGSVFALLGPNGAGKSTTIKVLTTLTRPDSGSAHIAGLSILKDPHRVRHVIGCVAQRSGVDVESTGRENLMLQGRLYGLRGDGLKVRVAELLERFSLAKTADRVARTYSGGMQRKLDIAMGLIHQPKILFLDEPTTGLDPEARADLWDEIARMTSGGLTILLTTHYLEEADRLAQCVAIIDRGRVVVQGAPEDLKAELRGDSVQVELANAATQQKVESALAQVKGLLDIQLAGLSLHAHVDHGAVAVPLILLALESEGVRVASVKVGRPSLDDVYLRHTGRAFEQDEQRNR